MQVTISCSRVLVLATLGFAALAILACGDSDGGKTLTIAGRAYADHGTKDVRGKSALDVEADSNYFGPTFLKGNPGQKATLTIENESATPHNFSVKSLGIDKDIPPKGKIEVEVTFPQTGAALFFCKLHTGGGMNGQLLAGDAAPQAAE